MYLLFLIFNFVDLVRNSCEFCSTSDCINSIDKYCSNCLKDYISVNGIC